MGNIGDPITSGGIPAVGTSGTLYASRLNLFLTEVKNRLEAKVPKGSLASGSLDMDGDAVQNASYVGLSDAGGVPSTPLNSIQEHAGELYWVSAGGVVKITNSGNLNAGSVGGITGDYGSPNPAEFRFVDVDQEFYAYDDYGAGTWAFMGGLGLDLFKDTTSTLHTRVKASGALAGTYSLTLPPSAPGSTSLLRMDSSGNVTTTGQVESEFSPDITTWIPFSSDGVVASGGTATGDGTWKIFSNILNPAGAPLYWKCVSTATAGNQVLMVPINLPVNTTLTQVVVYLRKASNAGSSLVCDLWKRAQSTGVCTLVGTVSEAGNATGDQTKSVGSLPHTITSSYSYFLTLKTNADPNVTDDRFYGVDLVYTS